MKKKLNSILSLVVLFTLAFSAVASASPNSVQPLEIAYAKYDYTAYGESHQRSSTDGIVQYELSIVPSRSENISLQAFVPGGLLDGGSVSLQLNGVGSHSTYNFTVSDFQWHDLYGHYIYEDETAGIFVTVMPGEDGDAVDVSKYAHESTEQTFWDGGTSMFHQEKGVYALQEQSQIAFDVIAANNQGETFQTSGVIDLQLKTPQVQEETRETENGTFYSYQYAETYAGEYVQP